MRNLLAEKQQTHSELLFFRFFRKAEEQCIQVQGVFWSGTQSKILATIWFESKTWLCIPLLWPLMAKLMATNLMTEIELGYYMAILGANKTR